MKTLYEGIDCVWPALDATGSVAVFITAGEGPIPRSLLVEAACDLREMEARLLELPIIGSASISVEVPDSSSFAELAKRGLFVFDWTDVSRTSATAVGAYEVVASPSIPISIDALPDSLRSCLLLTPAIQRAFPLVGKVALLGGVVIPYP